MTTSNVSGVNPILGGPNSDASQYVPQPATNPADKLGADKSTFLKLLVAQLRYQNPLNPADGLQFVTQLAQFTALEQSAEMRDELVQIRTLLAQPASGGGATEGS